MTLSTSEIESTRHHLGWGNMAVGSAPYTLDGFWHTFNQIVSPYLGTGTETSATTAITAASTTAVTPGAMTDIEVNGELVVGVGDQAEIVQVTAVTGSTFTAYFAKAHAATGYPIATMSGKARLRLLLHDANVAWRAFQDAAVGGTAGIKSLDKGDVVFQDTGGERGSSSSGVLKQRLAHYRAVVKALSQLVRVPAAPGWPTGGGCARLEAY